MNGIKAVLFDVNGTLVDIRTEENDAVFRAVANVLSYSGVALRRAEVRAAYADLMAE
jgi:putative hydrolase of the HAD superfamily